eukprot:4965371-Pyramimonas_sp.AAC.1
MSLGTGLRTGNSQPVRGTPIPTAPSLQHLTPRLELLQSAETNTGELGFASGRLVGIRVAETML